MLDVKFIREHEKEVKENTKKRLGSSDIVEHFLKKDKRLRDLQEELDKLRHSRNKISEEINSAKKSGDKSLFQKKIKEAQELPEKIKKCEEEYSKLEQETRESLLKIPNIMEKNVPLGKDASHNKVLRVVGKAKKIINAKNHVELIENLKIGDFEKSASVSGKGFYYIEKELALLNLALIRFAVESLVKKGYIYVEGPIMLKKEVLDAALDTKAFEDSIYKIEGEDLCLIGTSEHSILARHAFESFQENELPKKYVSYSICFRKEIGAHGINEKGLWRTHQFNKVEQFVFCKPKDSWKYFEELLKNTEELFKKLGLPYRVVEMCSGDLSSWKAKAIDIEIWRPTTKSYEEVASLSNCTDYQARKLNIKVQGQDKATVHTLNNTAIATSRAMVAILENYQQKDGSIKIPAVLQKYTGFKIIKPTEKLKSGSIKKSKKKK